jgi:hypothetical protein
MSTPACINRTLSADASEFSVEDIGGQLSKMGETPGRGGKSDADATILVASCRFDLPASHWYLSEWEVFQAKDPLGKRGLLLPVRLVDVNSIGGVGCGPRSRCGGSRLLCCRSRRLGAGRAALFARHAAEHGLGLLVDKPRDQVLCDAEHDGIGQNLPL